MPNEKTKDIKNYLESYSVNRRMLQIINYEKEYFGSKSEKGEYLMAPAGDEVFLKAKMFEVRRFVMSIEDNNCKLFLFYHYIKGESVVHCSELLGISRTSAFRLKNRALELAATKYIGNAKHIPLSA